MFEVSREHFIDMVRSAVDDLPPAFADELSNVDFAVEDVARPDDLGRVGIRSPMALLGVYRGIPLTRRGRGYNMALPDTIVIFQAPLQRLARDEADLNERVRHVVRHEIAHYFGISDERLREIDAY
jgi:predicted Zn-dependent protease with MMP-like domain